MRVGERESRVEVKRASQCHVMCSSHVPFVYQNTCGDSKYMSGLRIVYPIETVTFAAEPGSPCAAMFAFRFTFTLPRTPFSATSMMHIAHGLPDHRGHSRPGPRHASSSRVPARQRWHYQTLDRHHNAGEGKAH